jgi:hypothetical protein
VTKPRSFPAKGVNSAPLGSGSRKMFKHDGQKFLNNELRTVLSIDEGKIIFDEIEYEGLKTTADLRVGPDKQGQVQGLRC